MGSTLDAKIAIVEEVANVAGTAPSAIAAEYIGLTAADMTQMRKSAREAGVYVKVLRNTLARRALEDTSFDCMRDGLVGPLVLMFSNDEPGNVARVAQDFVKQNDKLVVKMIALDGKLLPPTDIDKLANIPVLDDARAMLLGLLSAPLAKFVRTLAEPNAKFVRVLAAKKDK